MPVFGDKEFSWDEILETVSGVLGTQQEESSIITEQLTADLDRYSRKLKSVDDCMVQAKKELKAGELSIEEYKVLDEMATGLVSKKHDDPTGMRDALDAFSSLQRRMDSRTALDKMKLE